VVHFSQSHGARTHLPKGKHPRYRYVASVSHWDASKNP
jgi:hypothetical protein